MPSKVCRLVAGCFLHVLSVYGFQSAHIPHAKQRHPCKTCGKVAKGLETVEGRVQELEERLAMQDKRASRELLKMQRSVDGLLVPDEMISKLRPRLEKSGPRGWG